MYVHGIRKLFRLPGYVVAKISMTSDLVQVNLRRSKHHRLACPQAERDEAVGSTLIAAGRPAAAAPLRAQTISDSVKYLMSLIIRGLL